MPVPNKKVTCLDCDKDFDPETSEGVCPNCGLDMAAIMERDRHERALQKLRDQNNTTKKKKKSGGVWGNW